MIPIFLGRIELLVWHTDNHSHTDARNVLPPEHESDISRAEAAELPEQPTQAPIYHSNARFYSAKSTLMPPSHIFGGGFV
ncbi:hypothetical protein SISNIDRAFT_450966, partial [Sistotremastrum niveocremeum HHB9708]